MRNERIVLSLGGNALARNADPFSKEAIDESTQLMRALYATGNKLAVVHGNGPQYGFLAEKFRHMNTAEITKLTQELIGFLLSTSCLIVESFFVNYQYDLSLKMATI